MPTVQERTLDIRDGLLKPKVLVAGDGPPVVFLHGSGGLKWNPFLDDLAADFTVYAPFHPGLSDPDDIKKIDSLWGLVLYYYELLDALGLRAPALVGHSYGGMLAAELAATNPDRVGKLVLLDAIGFWLDDRPVADWVALTPEELTEICFYDPEGEVARTLTAVPEDKEERQNHLIARTWALACTSRFIWPIPDKGLKHRIHRVKAPSLIIWGKQDRLVDPVYAQEYADRLVNAQARVEIIDKAAHFPHLEQRERVSGLVRDFLKP